MIKKRILTASMVSLLVIALFAAAIAGGTKTVRSTIDRGQWGAEQHLGSFDIPQGSTASNFKGGATVYNEHGQAENPTFYIEKEDQNGNYVKVYELSWQGTDWNQTFQKFMRYEKVEKPVALDKLTLGPGRYILSVGGYPGSGAEITFTIQP